MLRRKTSGSVVCPSCGSLVGINDDRCYTCGRRNPGMWGFAPLLRRFGNDAGFVSLVVYGCGVLYVATLLMSMVLGEGIGMTSVFSLLGPGLRSLEMFGVSGAVPVFVQGHWWTLLSAGWLHGGLLHIFFNMMWVRQLGPATADVYGSARMIIIYVVAGVAGFALSSFTGAFLPIPFLSGAGYTLGASANIFGLLGALVYYGRRSGSSMIGAQALQYAIGLFVVGLVMRGVDNAAHAGGFIGGYAAGMWLDPLRPERTDHAAGAAISLALTALAILASVVTSF